MSAWVCLSVGWGCNATRGAVHKCISKEPGYTANIRRPPAPAIEYASDQSACNLMLASESASLDKVLFESGSEDLAPKSSAAPVQHEKLDLWASRVGDTSTNDYCAFTLHVIIDRPLMRTRVYKSLAMQRDRVWNRFCPCVAIGRSDPALCNVPRLRWEMSSLAISLTTAPPAKT